MAPVNQRRSLKSFGTRGKERKRRLKEDEWFKRRKEEMEEREKRGKKDAGGRLKLRSRKEKEREKD